MRNNLSRKPSTTNSNCAIQGSIFATLVVEIKDQYVRLDVWEPVNVLQPNYERSICYLEGLRTSGHNDNRYFPPAPPQGNPTKSFSADRNCLWTSQNFDFQSSSVTFTNFIADHTFSWYLLCNIVLPAPRNFDWAPLMKISRSNSKPFKLHRSKIPSVTRHMISHLDVILRHLIARHWNFDAAYQTEHLFLQDGYHSDNGSV